MRPPIPTSHLAASNLFAAAARKGTLLLFSFALLLAGAAAVHGQSALDGFNSDVDDTVRVVVVQPDGKILIGGDFTQISINSGPVTRRYIARLNPDGTLDTVFNPNSNFPIYTIAVQADGAILVGGYFTTMHGDSRWRIARLDATTGFPDGFNPSTDGDVGPHVQSITVQPDGKILAGGQFTSTGGQPRNYIARLNANGLADSFDPNANGVVESIRVQVDNGILVGGHFTSIGGSVGVRATFLH